MVNYRDLMKAISRSIIKKISLIIVLLLVVTYMDASMCAR